MNLKNLQLHKKSQTSYLNKLLDVRLLKIRQNNCQKIFENESKITEDMCQIKTDYSESVQCCLCQQQILINKELKEQLQECQKQIDILKIEKNIMQKQEEQTIKFLIQEFEKSQFEQKKQSCELQRSFLQFTNESLCKQSQLFNVQEKLEENCQLQITMKQLQEQNQKYADLLHQQYDFSININIKFATMQNQINSLINLIQKYTKILVHIQMQSSPQLDLLLPIQNDEQTKKDQQQLIFTDLSDMTIKLQKIQLQSLTDVQQKVETLIKLVSEYLSQAQRIAINDMSRTII